MESSRGRRVEKRVYEESLEDEDGGSLTHLKKPRLPGLASVIVEALKVDSMQRLCSSLEPLFRKIVSEEVERALTKLGHAKLAGRSSPPRIQGSEGKKLQLHFNTRMPPHLFTGGKVEGEQGAAVHVVLLDASTNNVVHTGPESAAKLNIVVLEGDFNEEADDDWTKEDFEGHEIKEREGKRPLLTGELQVSLKGGVGTLGDMTFTDNSSWIRSRKFRLGLKVAPGYCEGVRVREAKTEAFAVKDHRGELYKKHYPPTLHDEVWRLDRIAKDGALHKKLIKADIVTVEDFLRLLVKDPQKLRSILGSGMSNRMWDNTVEHAKTCVLGKKLYVYYEDGTNSMGAVFNDIYELRGLIADGQFFVLDSLTHNQKVSVDSLVKGAYENWNQVVEYDGKVLNSLSIGKSGTRALAASTSDHSQSTTQNKQQCISSEPSPQSQPKSSHPSNSQLIEFPFMRSDSMAGMAVTTPDSAFGAVDYGSVGMSSYASSYLPEEWPRLRDGQGFEDFSEEIRLRSSEMLESDDLRRLLKSMAVGVGIGSAFGITEEDCYSYNAAYDHQVDRTYVQEHGRRSGRAVVGWLKLKAALRWGIFIRKRAAERRAQLVELD
ncbi:Calmodulin-binding protein 60 E like [Actinidia chinensis var. chinensis]|uniref:Calmodulin-binding protein 60 E like n=1 Tax=Actinidia chinensis var. chinensis TaxID=1590841 RepID=A0A2R6QS27_ACTCC|nr:Calmodulin-binding protein 60 E like [Actinidia chinensis var. chinensis]